MPHAGINRAVGPKLKTSSSQWLKSQALGLTAFSWPAKTESAN